MEQSNVVSSVKTITMLRYNLILDFIIISYN